MQEDDRMKKAKLTENQQLAIQKDNLSRMIISRTAQLQSYDKGLSPTILQRFLFETIPKDKTEYLEDKALMKKVVTSIRRNFGYPLLCTRGDGNLGEFRYYVADEKGLEVYNDMMVKIENGVHNEKKAMNKRFSQHKQLKCQKE